MNGIIDIGMKNKTPHAVKITVYNSYEIKDTLKSRGYTFQGKESIKGFHFVRARWVRWLPYEGVHTEKKLLEKLGVSLAPGTRITSEI